MGLKIFRAAGPVLALIVLFGSGASGASDTVFTPVPTLPDGAQWIAHMRNDLLPFWEMPTALGHGGDFPTYRCNDGSLYDTAKPCAELANPIPGIVWLDREYLRAKSRQIYAYGVAFHLTGDRKYLDWAKEGVDFVRAKFLDRDGGGAYTYYKTDGAKREFGPAVRQRTSQDVAYALSGLGMYYYLTRDEDVLRDLLALKEHIFRTYWDEGHGLIAWVREASPDGDQPNQKELVAQLDQIYGGMLWLTPILPEPHQSAWRADLKRLANVMMTQFYTPEHNLFWGAITDTPSKQLETGHTDFGHSVKTMWQIYEIGKLIDDPALVAFAKPRAAAILKAAYLPDEGAWARRPMRDGTIDRDKEWWILAELDQVAATLSLVDPYYANYLTRTWPFWMNHMVDRDHKEVWHWLDDKTLKPDLRYPKQHSWKNAFHTFEHALVGYLMAQQYNSKPSVLHFAFRSPVGEQDIHPYLYQGKIGEIRRLGTPAAPVQQVIFTDLH